MKGNIDLPGVKRTLWQQMRDDLVTLVPWFGDNELLLCPTCGRACSFDDFSLEHIIPQQALDDDPPAVRAAIPRNERSGLTLLCDRTLVFEKKTFHGRGCNSWKGSYYDRFIRESLRPNVLQREFNSRHHVAIFSMAYLGLFRKYGYQVALTPAGLLIRSQFFNPNKFLPQMPMTAQMILTGAGRTDYDEAARDYWGEPFKVTVAIDSAIVVWRNFSLRLPLSRNPNEPLARVLRYTPPRFKFRPDLTTVFD